MTPRFTFDTHEFDAALQARVNSTRRSVPEVVHQTAFNVAARSMAATKKTDPNKVRQYLNFAGGKPKGGRVVASDSNRFGSRHKRGARMLRSVTLIAQAVFFKKHGYGIGRGKSNKRTKRIRQVTDQQSSLFGKDGKRKVNDYGYSLAAKRGKVVVGSDYGEAMQKYAGKLFNRAVRSVGYLSAMWVPVLRALAPLAKFKGLAKGLRYGALWKTSSAVGQVSAMGNGDVAAVVLDVAARNPRMTPAAESQASKAVQLAIDAETVEMRRHLLEKLSKP